MTRARRQGQIAVVLGIALQGSLGLIALSVASCERKGSDEEDDDVLAGVDVTLHEALDIARAQVPDGIALEGELALGDPAYDVDLLEGGSVREVYIDAKTGEVTNVLSEPDDLEEAQGAAAALAAAAVSLDDAIDLAEEAGDGVAVAIDIEADDGTYQVVVVNDNELILVTVDLASGDAVVDDMPPDDD